MKVAFPTIPSAIITQKFNNYNPTMYGGDGKHKGIDFGVIAGTPIYACMDGEVSVATVTQTGYGRHARILHPDGSLSIYGHQTKLLVKVGDHVAAGQEIGKSGGDPADGIDGDGLSTGPHLHWEIRPPGNHGSDQAAVDPMEWCLQYAPGLRKEAEVTAYLGLRVRSTPDSSRNDNILYSFPHRYPAKVLEVVNGWARVLALRDEWCSADYLNFTGKEFYVGEGAPIVEELTLEQKINLLWLAHPELHT